MQYPLFTSSSRENANRLHYGDSTANITFPVPSSTLENSSFRASGSAAVTSLWYQSPSSSEIDMINTEFPHTSLPTSSSSLAVTPPSSPNLSLSSNDQKLSEADPLPLYVSTENLLHRVCFHTMGLHRVSMILKADPSAAGRAATVSYSKTCCVWNHRFRKMVSQVRKLQAPYKYPLHLVIMSTARMSDKELEGSCRNRVDSSDGDDCFFSLKSARLDDYIMILNMLLQKAPEILLTSDGANQASSLAILVKEWAATCARDETLQKRCLELTENMVQLEPSLLHRKDRHDNTILHIACQHFAPLDMVAFVYSLHPEALTQRNLHGLSPLEIAMQRMGSKAMQQENVVNYLKDRLEETYPKECII